jgi:uncharacterized membrane protein YgdD (TMEM256/DUF423 family)
MKVLFTTGALMGALAVILGAFGAHKLKDVLQPEQLQTFETGVRYHFYHVFAILAAGLLAMKFPGAGFETAGWFFFAGIILFSGSVYLLACKELLHLEGMTRILGPVTPVGGILFIIGWSLLALYLFRNVN